MGTSSTDITSFGWEVEITGVVVIEWLTAPIKKWFRELVLSLIRAK